MKHIRHSHWNRCHYRTANLANALRCGAFREYAEPGSCWDEADQRNQHERRFASQEFRIISVGDADVGYIAMNDESDYRKLYQFMIRPEYQGMSVERECMAIFLDEARRAGLPVRLGVMKTNP
jgi:ribosomal protein S18 acetylase RimI-like enzyme